MEGKREENSSQKKIIKLNIGGKKFTTSIETLTRVPESFFSVLIEGKIPSFTDEDGCIFVDRDGTYFEPILNFLRTGQLIIPPNIPSEAVLLEAEFYSISEIIRELRDEKDSCGGLLFEYRSNMKFKALHLATSENHLIGLFEDGIIRSWEWSPGGGWILQFTLDFLAELPVSQLKEVTITLFTMNSKTRWFFSAFYKGRVFICMGMKGKIHEVSSSISNADAIFFVKRGEFLAVTNYEDSKVALISVASLSERIILNNRKITAACWDLLTAYFASKGTISQLMVGFHENTTLKVIFNEPNDALITSICQYSGQTLLYGTENGEIRRLEFVEDRYQYVLILHGHDHPIDDLSLLRDGTIISVCAASHFRAWNQQIEKQSSYSLSPCIQRVLMEPFIFSLQKERLEIVEICSGKSIKTIYSVNDAPFISLAVCGSSYKGGMLLITSHQDGSLQFWNLAPLLVVYAPQ